MAGLIWVAYQFRPAIIMSLQFIVPETRNVFAVAPVTFQRSRKKPANRPINYSLLFKMLIVLTVGPISAPFKSV